MNIFYLDEDVKLCAQYHCDKHVNKMILEGAQLLASAHWSRDEAYALSIPNLYRLTHVNHPCAKWVRTSKHNYYYLLCLMHELNEEAKFRYKHDRDHLSLTKALSWSIPKLPDVAFTKPPKCVHDDFKEYQDTIEAYRAYYSRDKKDIAYWTARSVPTWFSN